MELAFRVIPWMKSSAIGSPSTFKRTATVEPMRFFRLNTMGDAQNRKLAFIDQVPDGLEGFDYKMALGEAIGEQYPEEAEIYLQPESPGIKLAPLIGNTLSYLIVNSEIKELIARHTTDEIEYLSFTLYNHKNRVHSTDYWIINPIGTHDCLNRQASEIRFVDSNPANAVVAVRKYVLDPQKLEGAPDLFRIPEAPKEYFVSETLARALHTGRYENVYIFKTEQQKQR